MSEGYQGKTVGFDVRFPNQNQSKLVNFNLLHHNLIYIYIYIYYII